MSAAHRPWETHYEAQRIEVLLETPTLRILDATFGPDDLVPWHIHNNIVDHFWVISGQLEIATRNPDQTAVLSAGEYFQVLPGCAHRVRTLSCECRFVNLQGMGHYDFVPASLGNPDGEPQTRRT